MIPRIQIILIFNLLRYYIHVRTLNKRLILTNIYIHKITQKYTGLALLGYVAINIERIII